MSARRWFISVLGRFTLPAVLALPLLLGLGAAEQALAQSHTSSGGYGHAGSSATHSSGTGSSGGYGHATTGSGSSATTAAPSGGDAAMSKSMSSDALKSYHSQDSGTASPPASAATQPVLTSPGATTSGGGSSPGIAAAAGAVAGAAMESALSTHSAPQIGYMPMTVAQPHSGRGLVLVVALLIAAGVIYWGLRRAQSLQMAGGVQMDQALPFASRPQPIGSAAPPAALPGRQYHAGQVLTLDLTPFVLAQGAKATFPGEPGSGRITVRSVESLVYEGNVATAVLDVGDGKWFELHQDPAQGIDQCRYFQRIDRISPASSDEWDFWLNEQDGLIGDPAFETKDGIDYQRVWGPGEQHVAGRAYQLVGQDGREQTNGSAMLYARALPSGARDYILVRSREAGDDAEVEVLAGLDVNATSLSLV